MWSLLQLLPAVGPEVRDDILQEIRRRVALRLKRSEKYLAAPKFFRAAADLCSPELRDEHWGKLREVDIEAVCDWHGIEHRKQRKAHLDRLREVHNIYLTRDGRASIAGLTSPDVPYVAAAIKEVVEAA